MKILLVNYHYFLNGGPDRYFFNFKNAVEKMGHQVIPFAFNYDETFDTSFREYFADPITGKGPCLLSQVTLSGYRKIKASVKMFYNNDVNSRFREIVEREHPDILYTIHLSSTMLPNILKIAKKEYLMPVAYRLSDFHMFCPSYLFARNGIVCTECIENLWACLRYRCMKNSRIASLLRILQMKFFERMDYYGYVDRFVCPSVFMYDFLVEHGIPGEKITHVPTFANDLRQQIGDVDISDMKSILYLGNVSKEKGIEVLLKAYSKVSTDLTLVITGRYEPEYLSTLLGIIPPEKMRMVKFTGFLRGSKLLEVMNSARFIVHPVLCYENMPNSILEAMSLGKAVITSNLGSMPELVKHGLNGLLVPAGDVDSLAGAMSYLSKGKTSAAMGQNSRSIYGENHYEKLHIEEVMSVFDGLVSAFV